MRVLVAEDDEGLRSVLERGLRESGYAVDAVGDGELALRYLDTYEYEVAILDWRMPKVSGLEVIQRLRRRGSALPILMLTARDTACDRVIGLDEGADDYLVKPFDFSELLARVRALQRRGEAVQSRVIKVANLALDTVTREVSIGSAHPRLTAIELALLEILMQRSPAIVSRRSIALGRLERRGRRPRVQHARRPHGPAAGQDRRPAEPRSKRSGRSAIGWCPHERRPLWSRPYVAHAARVAIVATVIIGAMYVCVVAGFNVVDRHRLVGQIDTRLQQRLAQAVRNPAAAGSIADYDNAHDVDDAPVFLWRVTNSGRSTALTPGAPALPRSAWSPSKPSVEAHLGSESFGLQADASATTGSWQPRVWPTWTASSPTCCCWRPSQDRSSSLPCSSGPCSSASRRPARWSWLVDVSSNSRPTRPMSSARR